MQRAARSYVTAAAAVATGSMIAVTPGIESGIHAHDVKLTSIDDALASTDDFLSNLIGPAAPIFADPLIDIQAQELSSNAALISQELAANTGLVTGEESLVSSIASAFPAATGTITPFAEIAALTAPADPVVQAFDRLFDANNLLLGASENVFNSIIGADSFNPVAINQSLLFDGLSPIGYNVAPNLTGGGGVGAPFLGGNIGGIQGAVGNDLAALSYALNGTLSAAVPSLGTAFNQNLLSNELLAEHAAFGFGPNGTEPLNGVVDRVINIGNLPLSTAENSFNSLIGADQVSTTTVFADLPQPAGITLPEEITASLLTGTGTSPTDIVNVFDTGYLGGAEGYADQYAALLADLAGLNSAEITSALAPGVFDPTLFSTAIGNLIDPTAFGNLTPDLGVIATDFVNALTALF
jgi:hypothetical protein